MPSPSRIELLLAEQADELDELDARTTAILLLLLQDAERELAARLAAIDETATPFTAQHTRVVLAQVEAAARQLGDRMGEALDDAARKAGEAAHRHLVDVIKINEPDFTDAGNQIEWAIVRRLAEEQGLLLHQYSVDRYTAEIIEALQRDLAQGMLQGENMLKMQKRLHRTLSHLGEHRAQLIVRMELNAAYNRQHQAALEEAAAMLDEPGADDPLMRQADEYRDRRNHPLSRALHGMVTGLREPWRVPVARVQAELAALNTERASRKLKSRRLGGILWPLQDGHYVGMVYPAHFNERGRQVPYRRSWDRPD